jgi:hypothetical protein
MLLSSLLSASGLDFVTDAWFHALVTAICRAYRAVYRVIAVGTLAWARGD